MKHEETPLIVFTALCCSIDVQHLVGLENLKSLTHEHLDRELSHKSNADTHLERSAILKFGSLLLIRTFFQALGHY